MNKFTYFVYVCVFVCVVFGLCVCVLCFYNSEDPEQFEAKLERDKIREERTRERQRELRLEAAGKKVHLTITDPNKVNTKLYREKC